MGKTRKRKNKKKTDSSCNNTGNPRDATTKNDVISNLPDDMRRRIVSLLPFESAVKTSLLSPRWRDLWKIPTVVGNGTVSDAFTALNQFLMDVDDQVYPSKNILGIQYSFCQDSVLLGFVSPNGKLHLDFSTEKQECLPEFEWLLHGSISCIQYGSVVNLPKLFFVNTIHLVSVNNLAKDAVSSLVSNCMNLESLTIVKCNGLQSLHINTALSIRSLTVLDCPRLKSFRFKTCSLQSLRYRGLLPSFLLNHDLCLEDVMLDIRKGPGYTFKIDEFRSILLGIKNVETLTLPRWTFEALICKFLVCNRWQYQFHRLKALWWIDHLEDDGKYNTGALISFLKLCPSLEKLYVTMDPESYKDLGTGIQMRSYWQSCLNDMHKCTRLQNVKVVKLEGFGKEEYEMLLAKKLIDEFSEEPRIVATSNENGVRSLVKVCDRGYKFVKDENRRHIEHVHMSL